MKPMPLAINPTSSSLAIASHGKAYYLVSATGKPLKKFTVKIIKGKLYVYLDDQDTC